MTATHMFRAMLTTGVSLLATACAVGPHYHQPKPAPVALAKLAPQLVSGEAPETLWWKSFQDPVLDDLVTRALGNNLDLRIAVARLREARSLFHDADLDRLPRVTSGGSYTRSDEKVPGFTTKRTDISSVELGFDASWEIDLFGRVRHGVQAAHAEAEAADADLRNVRITVAAEVARNYLQLRGAQERLDVAQANVKTARSTLELTTVRLQVGTGDPVDVETAKARLHATEAEIPVIKTDIARSASRLAVLVGQRPGSLDEALSAANARPMARATPLAIGDTETFLRRRPDVVAAERRLAAETARTGVATADLFPRLRITGFVGLLSGNWSSLFDAGSKAWAVSPTVSWPGLDLGGARARLHAQEARGDVALAHYDETVLTAIEELQNALIAYRERQDEMASLSSEVMASHQAAELAHIRYREGSIDFLRVLDAERTQLAAEDRFTQAKTAANTDVVAIYKAIGGA